MGKEQFRVIITCGDLTFTYMNVTQLGGMEKPIGCGTASVSLPLQPRSLKKSSHLGECTPMPASRLWKAPPEVHISGAPPNPSAVPMNSRVQKQPIHIRNTYTPCPFASLDHYEKRLACLWRAHNQPLPVATQHTWWVRAWHHAYPSTLLPGRGGAPACLLRSRTYKPKSPLAVSQPLVTCNHEGLQGSPSNPWWSYKQKPHNDDNGAAPRDTKRPYNSR